MTRRILAERLLFWGPGVYPTFCFIPWVVTGALNSRCDRRSLGCLTQARGAGIGNPRDNGWKEVVYFLCGEVLQLRSGDCQKNRQTVIHLCQPTVFESSHVNALSPGGLDDVPDFFGAI